MFLFSRLKEVLDRQKVAQCQRQKMLLLKDGNANVSKMDQLIAFLEREYDVMTSLVDAEISLEQLIEDRSIISVRIEELRQSLKEPGSSAEQELTNLREELELRNAQIADMQQKIYVTDLESYICSVGDNIHSMLEARAAMKHLWKNILDLRRDKTQSVEELKTQLSSAEEKCCELNKNIENLKLAHQHVIREYEEKISVILSPEQDENIKQATIDKFMEEVERGSCTRQNDLQQSCIMPHKVRV